MENWASGKGDCSAPSKLKQKQSGLHGYLLLYLFLVEQLRGVQVSWWLFLWDSFYKLSERIMLLSLHNFLWQRHTMHNNVFIIAPQPHRHEVTTVQYVNKSGQMSAKTRCLTRSHSPQTSALVLWSNVLSFFNWNRPRLRTRIKRRALWQGEEEEEEENVEWM